MCLNFNRQNYSKICWQNYIIVIDLTQILRKIWSKTSYEHLYDYRLSFQSKIRKLTLNYSKYNNRIFKNTSHKLRRDKLIYANWG